MIVRLSTSKNAPRNSGSSAAIRGRTLRQAQGDTRVDVNARACRSMRYRAALGRIGNGDGAGSVKSPACRSVSPRAPSPRRCCVVAASQVRGLRARERRRRRPRQAAAAVPEPAPAGRPNAPVARPEAAGRSPARRGPARASSTRRWRRSVGRARPPALRGRRRRRREDGISSCTTVRGLGAGRAGTRSGPSSTSCSACSTHQRRALRSPAEQHHRADPAAAAARRPGDI